MPIDLETTLNPEQIAAVIHGDGPQLVLAGAGSGKTRVITHRIAWLVEERGVDPTSITAVTFTNKAAAEMKGRVEDLLRVYPLPSFVGTFHRFALRLLRMYGPEVGLPRDFAIVDAADQLAMIKKAQKDLKVDTQNFPPRAVLSQISAAKNRLLDAVAYEAQADDFTARRVAPIFKRYQALLEEARGVDFDDMIRLSVDLLRGNARIRDRVRRRTRHLLVDEFQDTNHAQLALIRELDGGASLTAVGDEDQSIYRWRGAELSNVLEFERHFPGAEIRKLEQNYRSTQTILDAAGALVSNNERRRGKNLWTEAGAGEAIELYRAKDDLDEAEWVVNRLASFEAQVGLSGMAVLVRTNALTRPLEEQLLRRKMPYALIGSVRFYERAEIKDLVAFLRLVRNPHDTFSLTRVINKPPRGIGKSTLQALVNRAAEREKTPWQTLVDDDLAGFPVRSANVLLAFRDLLQGLIDESEELLLPELLRRVLEVTSYASLYENDDEGRAKLENIGELQNAVQEFVEAHGYASEEDDLLTAFLDHAALVSPADATAGESISLMTLHAAKGLEFPLVIIPGLEEDVLPHFNAGGEPEDLEEERRLLYVGMTRAEKRLLLSTASRRRRAGLYQDQRMSRFVDEIPSELLKLEVSPELSTRHSSASAIDSFFDRSSSGSPSATPYPARRRRPKTDDFDDGPRLDPAIRRGAKVRHDVLGRGKVLNVEGDGEDARITIYFDGAGRRKLIAKYAQLEVV